MKEKSERAPSPLPQPSLPKGGGAIASIGEKLSTHPQTGTASFSCPIATTPGRNGSEPKLSLDYDSSGGNGAFGLGWSLSVPMISRKTDRGLPRYPAFGAADDDAFVLSGAEDLVSVAPPITLASGEQMIAYRPRIDALFARIERRLRPDGNEYWVAISRDNVRSVYGHSPDARVTDPVAPHRVFRWSLEWTDDDRGNVTGYYYKPDLDPRGTNLYLKAIGYLNRTPRSLDDRPISPLGNPTQTREERLETWPLVVLFDYGDHDLQKIHDGVRSALAEQSWPIRKDPFSSHRATFAIRTQRLCRSVLMLHRITGEGNYDASPSARHSVVRVVRLGHIESPRLTRLESITQEGWRRKPGGNYESDSFPAIQLRYSSADAIDPTVRTLDRDACEGVLGALDGTAARLVDYDGEGLPGVLLSVGDTWWYKRPNGQRGSSPAWSPPARIEARPNVSLHHAQLQDWNGDGSVDIVQLGSHPRGVYLREPLPATQEAGHDAWRPFRELAPLPTELDFTDPNLRFADLDGDGFPDALLTEADVIRWYPKSGNGFGGARRVPKPATDARSERLPVFANRSEALLLADLTGDGLADVVHVTASGCAFWPNLGYGRFGARTVMANAPLLADRARFDPTRVRFADFDGSGTADLVYLDGDAVRVYPNLSGNGFGEELRFPLPQPANVELLDLWGRGTTTILWSSADPQHRPQPVHYIDPYAQKPHLLVSIQNGHGLETSIEYSTSTKHYLADRDRGAPWITRLPFPVHVIEQVTTVDRVAGTRDVRSFVYHHGYYDGVEREFRGFGMVEERDTQAFGDYYGKSLANPSGVEAGLHRPPVVTKSWFHTGAFAGSEIISKQYASEYDRSDPEQAALPDSVIANVELLSPNEQRQAVRCLRGRLLRQEVYAEDAVPSDAASVERATRPFTVTESNVTIHREEVAGDNNHAVFSVHPREAISYHYERNPSDPRIAHELTTRVSAHGTVLEQVSVVYPRRGTTLATIDPQRRQQAVLLASLTQSDLRDADATNESQRLDVAVAQSRYELIGLPSGSVLSLASVMDFLATVVEHDYTSQRRFDAWLSLPAGKHLVGRARHRYWNDDCTAIVPPSQVSLRALPARTETIAHTKATLAAIVARDTSLDLPGLLTSVSGGYIADPDGTYWAPSATAGFDRDRFFVAVALTNPFGGVSSVEYDDLVALPQRAIDAAGNPTTIVSDYRLFAVREIEDANGTKARVETDVLGIVRESFIEHGSEGGQTTSIKYGFYGSPEAPTRITTQSFPVFGDSSHFEESTLYCDGSGREALRKIRVPPGPALLADGTTVHADPRWVGSGQSIFDNKQQPVKQYEPYFSTNGDFENEASLVKRGVTPVMHYDAVGRLVRVDLPNGTHREVRLSPWTEAAYDEIDTLTEEEPWYATRKALAATELEQQSAAQSFLLRNTPSVKHFDTLGRAILTLEDAQATALYATRQERDLGGHQLAVIDPRGLVVLDQTYDLAGRPIENRSVDGGLMTTLLDVAGKPLLAWQAEDVDLVRTRHVYDRAERPTEVWVTDRHSSEALRERVVYRDYEVGVLSNHAFGRVAAELDGGGLLAFDYDFIGNASRTTRWVASDKTQRPEWSAAQSWTRDEPLPALLAPEAIVITRAFDALAREIVRTTSAGGRDSGTVSRALDVAGRLLTLTAVAPGVTKQLLTAITYDEKGQRFSATHGHGVTTTYEYDTLTFRLKRKLLRRSNNQDTLQDWQYTYDPVGNLTAIVDQHADAIFFGNTVALPERSFRYDSLYRLKHAHGREHIGQSQPDQRDVPTGLARPLNANNLAQIVPYDEDYDYDESNNLRRVVHTGSSTPWTRELHVETTSNRLNTTKTRNVTTPYAYDQRGQLAALPHLDRMFHSQSGQLLWATRTKAVAATATEAPTPDASPVYFAYDRRGQRVWKHAVSGIATKFTTRVYADGFDVYEDSDGLVRETLDIADDTGRITLIETRVDGYEQLIRHQHNDHQTSASLELDDNASPLTYEEHHPFGTTALQLGKAPKRFRFTGQERDEETGLQYHHLRYFAPWLSRWTTADPKGLVDGTNRYSYCGNCPISVSDKGGTDRFDELRAHSPSQPRDQTRTLLSDDQLRAAWNPADEATLRKKIISGYEHHLKQQDAESKAQYEANKDVPFWVATHGLPQARFAADGKPTELGAQELLQFRVTLRLSTAGVLDPARRVRELHYQSWRFTSGRREYEGMLAFGIASFAGTAAFRVGQLIGGVATLATGGTGTGMGRAPLSAPIGAGGAFREPVTRLYHGGKLAGGKVGSRRFSTTPDPAHAQAYADEGGGDVYMFDVPTRLLRSLEPTGGVQKRIDVHLRSGSEAVEYRFSRSTAGQLNDFAQGVLK